MSDLQRDDRPPHCALPATHEGDDAARGDDSARGFLEILLYATGDHRLVLALDGSGVPRVNLAFHSGAELGDFFADLLATGDRFPHPVLAALREAAERLPPAR
jgi:hypothetical protein